MGGPTGVPHGRQMQLAATALINRIELGRESTGIRGGVARGWKRGVAVETFKQPSTNGGNDNGAHGIAQLVVHAVGVVPGGVALHAITHAHHSVTEIR